MPLEIEMTFDKKNYRHYMNGFLSVMHCHHYMSLLTKLAERFESAGGIQILVESVEDTIKPMLDDYVKKHEITEPVARLDVGKEYYAIMGMGTMEVVGSETEGLVTLTKCHVDAGWIKKWGKHDKPINHWTRGYICAMFDTAFSKAPRSYQVTETASLVKGDLASKFAVSLK